MQQIIDTKALSSFVKLNLILASAIIQQLTLKSFSARFCNTSRSAPPPPPPASSAIGKRKTMNERNDGSEIEEAVGGQAIVESLRSAVDIFYTWLEFIVVHTLNYCILLCVENSKYVKFFRREWVLVG